MIISRISAQIVMIGIDSEQIMPMLDGAAVLHAPPSPMSSSLCSGHGSTWRTRSMKPRPFARCTWPHSMSESTNAVSFACLRRPAGLVSSGRRDPDRARRRVGVEEAGAARKRSSASDRIGGWSGPQSALRWTKRMTNQPGSPTLSWRARAQLQRERQRRASASSLASQRARDERGEAVELSGSADRATAERHRRAPSDRRRRRAASAVRRAGCEAAVRRRSSRRCRRSSPASRSGSRGQRASAGPGDVDRTVGLGRFELVATRPAAMARSAAAIARNGERRRRRAMSRQRLEAVGQPSSVGRR